MGTSAVPTPTSASSSLVNATSSLESSASAEGTDATSVAAAMQIFEMWRQDVRIGVLRTSTMTLAKRVDSSVFAVSPRSPYLTKWSEFGLARRPTARD